MSDGGHEAEAVQLLTELGLTEYEARCFVALTKLTDGTAKSVSEISEVPRTQVYGAVESLEERGLVAVEHSNPRRFRTLPLEDAVEILREEHLTRTEALQRTLAEVEPVNPGDSGTEEPETWTVSEETGIDARTDDLLAEADEEVLYVVGERDALGEETLEHLRECTERGVTVVVATANDEVRDRVQTALPDATVTVSGLALLDEETEGFEDTDFRRVVLVDRRGALVSTETDGEQDHAVVATGEDNGVVAVTRRLLYTGLADAVDGDRFAA